jgi:hypothetical protein
MEQARDEPKSASVHFEESSVDLSPTENENRSMMAEEAFWLCDNKVKTSISQPAAVKPEERLILGGSQPIPKKNIMLEQKLFGHLIQNPRNSNTSTMKVEPKTEQAELNTQDIQMTMSDDEDDFQVLNRQLDPFRMYCDADSPSIGPGYFNSARVTHAIPLVDNESERQRRDRILYKLEKGTLGERVEENVRLEEEMDDDIKEFLLKYNNDEEVSTASVSQVYYYYLYAWLS